MNAKQLAEHIRQLHAAKMTISHAIGYLTDSRFELHSFNILDHVFLNVIIELNRALRVQEGRMSREERVAVLSSPVLNWW